MSERWRPVAGYEGLYEVSDQGRVRSLDREVWRKSRTGNLYSWVRPGQVMKQYRGINSPRSSYRQYWQISLRDANGVAHHHMVHQLVARTFLGPCPPGKQCCHGPAGKLVNSVSNLSYGTAVENQADRVRDDTVNNGSRNGRSKLTEDEVLLIRLRHELGETQKSLAEEFCVSRATISGIITRQSWAWL